MWRVARARRWHWASSWKSNKRTSERGVDKQRAHLLGLGLMCTPTLSRLMCRPHPPGRLSLRTYFFLPGPCSLDPNGRSRTPFCQLAGPRCFHGEAGSSVDWVRIVCREPSVCDASCALSMRHRNKWKSIDPHRFAFLRFPSLLVLQLLKCSGLPPSLRQASTSRAEATPRQSTTNLLRALRCFA